MSNNFVHLHLHSEHSLLDGLGKVDKIFEKAKSLNHNSIAITDHGNLDCYVKAIQASEKYGIKYIPGCEFYIVDNIEEYSKKRKKDEEKIPRLHMTIWAKNVEGVRAIFRLLNIANKKFAKGRPNLEWTDIESENLSNVIVGTGCAGGIISRSHKDFERILDLTEDVFIEVMPHQMKMQIDVNKIAEEYSRKYNIPIIATCDAHYVEKDHYYFQEVLLAIQSKTTWDNPDRWRFDINDLYLKSEEEVTESFLQQKVFSLKQIKNYIDNTKVVAEMSECVFKPIKVKLPKVLESKEPSEDILIEHAIDGFHRLQKNNSRMKKYESDYIARIEEELSLIVDLGFEEYFLLVEDLIQWAKSQDILIGPGRGSSGGSLVAYCLGITNVDPLEYGLLFARFISPARIDLPDIDMDFEDLRRDEIKSYLIKKYGKNRVVAVSTFLEMHGRGALRDTARVFKIPLVEVDGAAKSIVTRSGGDVRSEFTIKDAFTVFEEGKAFYKKYKNVSEVAMALEGCIKAVGIHAAGVVISTKDFDKGYYGYLRKGARGDVAINWDKEDLEYMGLMKLDILGLNVLTILSKARQLVKERIGKEIDYYNLKFNDKKVFDEFNSGNTVGIFQYNSYGIRKLSAEVGVENFNDMVAINSLFRPGPLRSGLCTEYTKRKKGESPVTFIHPVMEELTKDTYGIILYQEQIMNLLYKLSGMQWKTVDMVRKVISKSKGEEQFLKFEQQFIDGCLERKTIDKITAKKLFGEMKFFGSYSFNLSHSVEYSMIAYWGMFMKVYYPAEFFESLMTWGSAEHKLQIYIDEMKRMGFNIHPVDIKKSFGNKWHIEEKDVYPPVSVLKGIGDKASIAFDEWKSNSKIKDVGIKNLLDIKSRAITSRVKTILDGGGAFNKKNINYQLYPYSWETKRDMDKLFNIFNRALELKMLGKGKSKESNWYFAQITETKFGYHQKVKKQTQDLKSVLGLADALGGVYGYARDKDGGYQMITFKGTVYQDKKYAVEHSAGKWALFNGNVVSFSENIIVEDIYFEDEIMECNFDKEKIRLDLYDNIKVKPMYNIQECYDCELRKECSKPVPSEYRSNVLIVGEAPGASENKLGINFCGAAGDLLWKIMYKFGLERTDFSVVNVGKCYPSSTKNPKPKHIALCKKWFDEDIKAINPIIVLTLGRIATEAMLGEPVKITEASGKVFWSREYLCWVVPSIHPAAVKRGAFPEKDLENFTDFFVGKLETFISKEI
jgi:DNA polymerase-3 subunit alpha